MAPRVPDEIDVFTAPHSRMKELVNIYTRKMSCVDFRDVPEVVTLLQDLDTTLREFKSHESIENIFIMDQLRNRLKQHQISNTAVCDCHNDNQLSDVVQLVRRGTQVRERSVGERITFGLQLQQAFQAFVNTFLPHMEEEEQVFQPMLVEYFEYEELKVLREIVLKEHELAKERWHVEKAQDLQEGQPETHSSVKDLRDLDWDLCSLTEALDGQEAHDSELGSLPPPLPLPPEQPPLPPDHYLTQDPSATNPCPDLHSLHPQTSCHTLPHHTQDPDSYSLPYPDCQTDHYLLPDYQDLQYHQDLSFDSQTHHIPSQDHSLSLSPCAASSSSTPTLPTDVLVEIFRYLVPPDLGRCAQVCSAWNSAVFSPTLWPAIFPVQWARGIWEWHDVGLCGVLEDEAFQQQQQGCGSRKWDEDADVDETEEGEESTGAVWECRVMESLVQWVLPRVGVGVSTMVVDVGQGITSRLLHQALLLCPNLTFLSAAHSSVDSYTFKGLWLQSGLHKLRHLDLQGCELVDDSTLHNLALCLGQSSGQSSMALPTQPYLEELVYEGDCCRCGYSGPAWPNMPCQGRNRNNRNPQRPLGVHLNSPHVDIEEIYCPRGPAGWEVMMGDNMCRSSIQSSHSRSLLASLNLSGCWRIKDKGLLALGAAGGLLGLTFLDVSGCYQLTGQGLEAVARVCPALPSEKLWYCDDILDGPFPTMANGCANLANPVRICCRSGQ